MTRGRLKAAASAIRAARYEVIPTSGVEQSVLEWVPLDMTIAVTASPTKGLDTTLELAGRLADDGYRVVPHVSARLVQDAAHLRDIVARLTEQGIEDVFVPAGDADPPAGPFDSALALLTELEALGRPFPRVGITGYPETHPLIDDDVTIQAMWDKRRYATYIVSNLCFDPAILKHWVHRVRARGVTLPLRLGLAGPVERTKLVAMASKIGVEDSARFLKGHGSWLLRFGAPGGYSPSRLLDRLGPMLADPASVVEGLHVFTFNQLRETEQWRRELLEQIDEAARPTA
ncbi:MAG: methylenetetrahydrofolate reductase [Acidimicrobiales bacterium]|jgi:methylenetetrahydrofolate reductase (NADPH)